ncbi:MAG: DNA-binding response regulator, partial [Cyanobacteria bacterium J083]
MGKEAIKILLVDNDPIFRLGLVTALKPLNDIKIIAHFPLEGLAKELVRVNELPDLIVIDPFFLVQTPAKDLVKQACQILQKKYTDIPIFLLTKPLSQKQLKQYKLLGIKGYCSKGTGLNVLVDIFRQIARGEEYWQTNVLNNKSSLLAKIRQNKWLYHWQNSGINQIDYRLRQIQQELKEDDFSFLDWLVLQGRKRELLAARWLVSKMAESPGNQAYLPAPLTNPSSSIKEEKQREIKQLITQQQFKVTIFINTAQKIPLGTKNLTDITLEIDILTPEKKEKLIYLVLIKLNQLILESAGSSLSPKNLP